MEDQRKEPVTNLTTSTEAVQDIVNVQGKVIGISPKSTYIKLVQLMKAVNIMVPCSSKVELYIQLAIAFEELSDYKNSQLNAEKCRKLAKKAKKALKQQIYDDALDRKSNAKEPQDYFQAAKEFRRLKEYQDAKALAQECVELGNALEKKAVIHRFIAFSLTVIGIIAIIIFSNTSFAKYHTANAFMKIGSYKTAITMYQKMDHYKDSDKRLVKCQYLHGVSLQNAGENIDAEKAFAAAGNYKDSQKRLVSLEKSIIKASKTGDVISIGKNEWVILDIKDNQAFLLMKSALPVMAYNDSLNDVTWESSSIRQWLNTTFMTENFSKGELKDIVLTNVVNNDNPVYGTDGGNNTQDYIFFLSSEEASQYSDLLPTMKSNTWLRTPGETQSSAAFLSVDKKIMDYGYAVDSVEIKVRPVMWFGLD